MKIIQPQEGPQTEFMKSPADVVIYGGAAGGGKTYGMLVDALRHIDTPNFGAVFFREHDNQITAEGGLWDESAEIYGGIRGAIPKQGNKQWVFIGKHNRTSKITFRHIERDLDCLKWQGAQICGIYFDELTHFSEYTFFYMFSRNRSTCGVVPYIRASCNPDADSWVANFISWWIDQDTGYPIPERSGEIRWFIRRDAIIYWADTKEELIAQFNLKTEEELSEPKSMTFIASSVYDNKALLETNPQYLANLKALPEVERERLLKGNWKIKPNAGLFFQRTQVGHMLSIIPKDVVMWARGWDLAATSEDEEGEPAYTAGVLMGKMKDGRYIVADVINKRLNADDVRKLIRLTAETDRVRFGNVSIRLPQDPGQAGKDQAQAYIKYLAGFIIKAVKETGSKEARAVPVASQWQAGNFDVVVGDWNEMYFDQLESFPQGKYKDMVDATSAAFAELETTFDVTALIS